MKRLSKKIGLLCGMSLCATMLFVANSVEAFASEAVAVEDTNDTRATNLEWYYKEIDGEMYMRLYNHSTGEWLTDWIPAVYPE